MMRAQADALGLELVMPFKNPVPYKIDEIYHHAPVFPSGDAANFYYAKLIL